MKMLMTKSKYNQCSAFQAYLCEECSIYNRWFYSDLPPFICTFVWDQWSKLVFIPKMCLFL